MVRRYVCNNIKHWKNFIEGTLLNKLRSQRYLRCNDCFHCPGCNKVKNGYNFHGHSKKCRDCSRLWTCKPCGQSFLADMFDALNFKNHQNTKRLDFLVCKKCRVDGYIPRDTTDYPCEICGAKGCGAFEKEELEEYKKASAVKKPKMVCKTCSIAYERLKTFFRVKSEFSNKVSPLLCGVVLEGEVRERERAKGRKGRKGTKKERTTINERRTLTRRI